MNGRNEVCFETLKFEREPWTLENYLACGGYQAWQDRAGRFRSVGDGDVDFGSVFSLFSKYGYDGWAVLEWECCFKDGAQGAAEGAPFIAEHMITRPKKAFDDAGYQVPKT